MKDPDETKAFAKFFAAKQDDMAQWIKWYRTVYRRNISKSLLDKYELGDWKRLFKGARKNMQVWHKYCVYLEDYFEWVWWCKCHGVIWEEL
jgi:hypothetical protein